ncbi:hypothetical protein BH10ACI2_BH10ACI2_21270 [soil metagenome]
MLRVPNAQVPFSSPFLQIRLNKHDPSPSLSNPCGFNRIFWEVTCCFSMFIKTLVFTLTLLVSSATLCAQQHFQFTHKGSVLHTKFSPSGLLLLSYSSGNQDMALWEVSTGRLLWKRPISFIQKADEYYTLNSFAWSPDEKLVGTGSANGTVQLWRANDGTFLWRADAAKSDISAIAFSPDGKTIAATSHRSEGPAATLLNVVTGHPIRQINGNKCPAIGIFFDPSGNELSIGNVDGNVGRWNLLTDKAINAADCKSKNSYGGERSFSEDLSYSVRRTTAGQVVIERTDGEVVKTLTLNDSRMRSLVNSRAKKAVVEEYGGYHIYDLSSGSEKKMSDCVSGSAFDLSDDGKLFAQSCDGFKTSIKVTDLSSDKSWLLDGHPSAVNAIVYSPDFSLLAVAGNDGNAYFFDPTKRTLKQTLTGDGSRLTALAFSADGKTVITGDEKGSLKRRDFPTGTVLNDAASERSDDIDKIEASADGKNLLVVMSSSAGIFTSDLKDLKPLQTAEGYTSTSGNMTSTYSSVPIETAAFGSGGKYVITGHSDGTLRFWDTSTARQIRKLKIADVVKFVAPVDDKNVLVVASVGKKGHFQLVDSISGRVTKQSRSLDDSYLEKMFLSPDGRFAAVTDISGDTIVCSLDTMTLWDVDYDHSGSDSVAFSRDGRSFFIGGENQNLSLYGTRTLKEQWSLLPNFKPSPAVIRLDAERAVKVVEIKKIKKERDDKAAAYVKATRNKVYVTFEHFGDMSDPGEKHMVESNDLKESNAKKQAAESNAVWLRLHNNSNLPIQVPSENMYMPDPKCFYEFPNGEKIFGLCKDREIGIWFGVKDSQGKWLPYGFDFGSSVILLPNSSVVFPVPLSVWNKSYSIVFDYSFQNVRASENDREMDFGEKVEIKVSKSRLQRR